MGFSSRVCGSTRRCLPILGVVTSLVVVSRPVGAQERQGLVYLLGGPTAVRQDGPSGESSQTYRTAPGGTTVGWLVGGGVFVVRVVSADLEFSSTGVMRATEPSRYFMTFNEERRDRMFVAGLRLHLPPGHTWDLEPVVGGLVVRGTAWSRIERSSGVSPGQVVTEPRVQETVPTRYGFAAGLDARFGSARVAVVPSFRILWANTREELTPMYPGGIWSTTIRAGVAFRIGM
jgi:hypothetical protein